VPSRVEVLKGQSKYKLTETKDRMAKISSSKKTPAQVIQKSIGDVEKDAAQLKKGWTQQENMEEKLKQQETKLKDKIAALEDKIAALEDKHQISGAKREELEGRLDKIDL